MYSLKNFNQRPNIKKVKKIIEKTVKNISSKDSLQYNATINKKPKFYPWEPEEFKKEYQNTHWLTDYTDKLRLWYHAPFMIRLWNSDKDTELGRYSWNSNGYNNSLSNILYRNESLQTKRLMDLARRRCDHRYSLSVNKAEEPPKIDLNSVFLYRDSTYTIVTRRSVEKFAFLMVVTMAWNPSSLIMYGFLGWYFQLITKNYFASKCNVVRMDLLPSTEQLHMIKIGMMGFPISTVVNISDIVKIDKCEDPYCKILLI